MDNSVKWQVLESLWMSTRIHLMAVVAIEEGISLFKALLLEGDFNLRQVSKEPLIN